MSEHLIRLVLDAASRGCASALDVGSGPGKYRPLVPHWITLDARETAPSDRHILGEALDQLRWLDAASVDLVYALDVLEHFEPLDGVKLLAQMTRIARRRVLVFTPNGFQPQESPDPWQCHRSGWTPEQLRALGFATAVMDFDYGKGDGLVPGSALWAVKEIGT